MITTHPRRRRRALAATVITACIAGLVALLLQPAPPGTDLGAGPAASAAMARQATRSDPPPPAPPPEPAPEPLVEPPPPSVPDDTRPAPAPAPPAAPAAAPAPVADGRGRAAASPARGDPQAVGAAALSLLSFDWRHRLDVVITFVGGGGRTKGHATTWGRQGSVEIHVGTNDSPVQVAFTIAHELAHVYDVAYLTDADRAEWLAARGRPGAAWWTCDYCDDFGVGSGDFAEVFAAWQLSGVDFRSRLAPLPSPSETAALAARFFSH